MWRSGQSVAVLVVFAGCVAVAAARPAVWRAPVEAADDIDARRQKANALNEFSSALADELARGRIDLGEATDRVIEANADRPGYLVALRMSVGGPTVRASVARSLLYRAENPFTGPRGALPALRAEYAALFGHPYAQLDS